MKWKELISEFNQRFGPESANPVTLDGLYLPPRFGVGQFLLDRLLPEEEVQRFAVAHYSVGLDITKLDVSISVRLMKSHPLWDVTLGFGKDSNSETILRLKRKKLPSGKWGCILERPDGDLDSEINLLSMYCVSALEREIEGDYQMVEVLDWAIKILTPDFFQEVMSAQRVLDYRSSRHLVLNCQYGDLNIMCTETRQRLLSKLAAFEGKTEEDRNG